MPTPRTRTASGALSRSMSAQPPLFRSRASWPPWPCHRALSRAGAAPPAPLGTDPDIGGPYAAAPQVCHPASRTK
ncbi:hypothetical protein ABZY42_16405 [Streptomyces sp. NPDC006622]|uniref:hypothetical protein n=1 Tax=Streptomyces sp. NPDC006622 TaxID=3155459 RepID=UPI0033A31E1E